MSSVAHRSVSYTTSGTYTVADLPSREQIADKMFSESCIELARIRDLLAPAFARHQKALAALHDHGREAKYPGMGRLMMQAWMEFQVQETVKAERNKA